MAVKYHEKLKLLKDAAVRAACGIDNVVKDFRDPGSSPDGEPFQIIEGIAEALRAEVLRVYPGTRSSMTPEEREVRDRQRRFDKGRERLLAQLRKMGLVQGARAINTATGSQVVLAHDPALLATGIRVRVAPVLPDNTLGEIREDDATAYRPDFSEPQTVEANTPKARRKARKSQRAAS